MRRRMRKLCLNSTWSSIWRTINVMWTSITPMESNPKKWIHSILNEHSGKETNDQLNYTFILKLILHQKTIRSFLLKVCQWFFKFKRSSIFYLSAVSLNFLWSEVSLFIGVCFFVIKSIVLLCVLLVTQRSVSLVIKLAIRNTEAPNNFPQIFIRPINDGIDSLKSRVSFMHITIRNSIESSYR